MQPAGLNAQAFPATEAGAADQKSRAAAPPVAQRTAVAAAGAMVVAQPDLKAFQAEAFHHIRQLTVAFQRCDPTITPEMIAALSLNGIIMFAQMEPLFSRAVTLPDNACKPYRVWSRLALKVETDKALTQFLTLTKCPQAEQKQIRATYEITYAAVPFLKKHIDQSLEPVAAIEDKGALLKVRAVYLRYTQNMSLVLKKVWENFVVDFEAFISTFKTSAQALPKEKRRAIKEISDPRVLILTESTQSDNDIAMRCLRQLSYFTKKKFPNIAFKCLELNLDNQDGFVIANLHSILKTSKIAQILRDITLEIGRFEATVCFENGHHPKTAIGKATLEGFLRVIFDNRAEFFSRVMDPFTSFYENEKNQELLNQTCSEKDLDSLRDFVMTAQNPTNAKPAAKLPELLFADLSAITQGIIPHFNECLDRFTKAPGYKSFFWKQELHIWGNVLTNTVIRKFFRKKTPTWKEILGLIIHSIASYIEQDLLPLTRSDNSSELFQNALTKHIENRCELSKRMIGKTRHSNQDQRLQMNAELSNFIDEIEISYKFLLQAFTDLNFIQQKVSAVDLAEETVRSNACLNALLLEEETELAQRLAEETDAKVTAAKKNGYHQQKRAAKQQQASQAAAAAAAAPQPAPAPVPTPIAPRFQFAPVQTLFGLRNVIAEWHTFNPATIVPPSQARSRSLSDLARHQQVYAFDAFLTATELLMLCKEPQDAIVTSQQMLRWGHLALEQGLTVKYAQKFPKALEHNLRSLLHHLGMKLDGNFWAEQAHSFTLHYRYPAHYTVKAGVDLPLPLKHVQSGDQSTLKEMQGHLFKLLKGAAEMQVAALTNQDSNSPLLKKAQTIVEALRDAPAASAESDQKHTEALADKHAFTLTEWELKLQHVYEGLGKTAASENAAPSLKNAQHHLRQLMGAIGLLKRLPQQRFLHLIVHLLISSIKDFVENYGTYLALQDGYEIWTHHLHALGLDKLLEGNGNAIKTLQEVDIFKGNEYPYNHFAFNPADKISPMMHLLSKFYVLSQEAIFMGSAGATPSGMHPQDIATLHSEVVALAIRFAELAIALTKQK